MWQTAEGVQLKIYHKHLFSNGERVLLCLSRKSRHIRPTINCDLRVEAISSANTVEPSLKRPLIYASEAQKLQLCASEPLIPSDCKEC